MATDLLTAFEQFGRLRSLSAEERELELRVLAERDAALAAELERLLRADGADSACFLDRPVADLGTEEIEPTPERIGPYRVERELGRGAFGTVFLAERDGPARQRAAVKLLHGFRGARQTVRRFEREMRALTEIEDPGVARLLDAGLTADGVPYIATEHVDGERIDRYCRRARPPLSLRLRLVAEVCRAVHHAHQKSIVHRDIKPSNVLIGEVRGRPAPRVIDFGVAKLLEAGDEDITVEASVVGTPGFMSPEQRAGEPVDARSDVYALGVLLACVLSGGECRPGEAQSAAALIANYHGPRRADLTWIVKRATQPARADRFPSAAHMAEELERVIRGRTLLSRKTSPLLAMRLYTRRHPLTATMLALLVILAGLLTMRVAMTNQNLDRLVRSQSDLIAQTTGIVTSQLSAYTGTTETRAALIDGLLRSAQALKADHPEDPSIDIAIAQLLGASGDLAYETGELKRAREIREDVARRAAELAARGALDVDRTRWYAESVVKCGDMELHERDFLGALQRYEEALAIQHRATAVEPAHLGLLDDISWSWDRIGAVHHLFEGMSERYAEKVGKRLETARHLYALDPSRMLSVYNLADAEVNAHRLFTEQGRHDEPEAHAHLQRATALAERLVAAEPARVAFVALLLNCLLAESAVALQRDDFETAHAKANAALRHADALLSEAPHRIEAQHEALGVLMHCVRVYADDPARSVPEDLLTRIRLAMEQLPDGDRVFERRYEALLKSLAESPDRR